RLGRPAAGPRRAARRGPRDAAIPVPGDSHPRPRNRPRGPVRARARLALLGRPVSRPPAPLPPRRRRCVRDDEFVAAGAGGGAGGARPPAPAAPLGEGVETPRFRFRVIHTPGHATDHVALFEPERGWLFSGDLYLAPRLRYLRADEDVYAMMNSLRRVLALEP